MNKQWIFLIILGFTLSAYGMEIEPIEEQKAEKINPSSWHLVGKKYSHSSGTEYVQVFPPIKKNGELVGEIIFAGKAIEKELKENDHTEISLKVQYILHAPQQQESKIIYPVTVFDKEISNHKVAAIMVCSEGVLYFVTNKYPIDLSQFQSTQEIPDPDQETSKTQGIWICFS